MMFAVHPAQSTPPKTLLFVLLVFPPFMLIPLSSILHIAQCGIDFFPRL
jgi:hypothetical protein